jgi:hypothetical protein
MPFKYLGPRHRLFAIMKMNNDLSWIIIRFLFIMILIIVFNHIYSISVDDFPTCWQNLLSVCWSRQLVFNIKIFKGFHSPRGSCYAYLFNGNWTVAVSVHRGVHVPSLPATVSSVSFDFQGSHVGDWVWCNVLWFGIYVLTLLRSMLPLSSG